MTLHTYIGEPVERRKDEIDYFTLCATCGQPIDKRDLEVLVHHMDDLHGPLPADMAFRLVDDPSLKAQLSSGRFDLTVRRDG